MQKGSMDNESNICLGGTTFTRTLCAKIYTPLYEKDMKEI